MLIVMKFGGSSLASASHIRHAAELILQSRQEGNQTVVVVSAQGNTTDALVCRAQELSRHPDARESDVLLSCGEQISMSMLAIRLRELGCPAVSLCGWQAGIFTHGQHGDARIYAIDPGRIRRELASENVVIVAGFQGVDEAGDITTIGRGGSDTTAVALAAALQADVCRIYTDVKGVYSADPRLVEAAMLHRDISYEEMLEMASLGAQVLHSRAVELAREKQVNVEVRSTFDPGNRGTFVCSESSASSRVCGVTCDNAVSMVTVHGLDTGLATGTLFSALAESGISIDVIIRSPGHGARQGTVSFSVAEKDGDKAAALVQSCHHALDFRSCTVESGMAKVSVVGAGMADGCGVAAKMLRALQDGAIEPRYITTGELRISVILPKEQAEQAVKLIHRAFFEG